MSDKSTHVVMKKSLAKALMDAGMHHYDGGGVVGGGGAGGVLSDVSGALTTQNTFTDSGLPDQAGVTSGQNNLAGQLQQQAAGGGPNPAQIMYQQNAQKIAQTAANTNSQNRALNPGLAARLSGNQAVQSGQQAAGGAAAQQAQQQIAAQQQLNSLYAQQQNAGNTAAGINAQVSQNNANAVNQTEGGLLNGIGGAIAGPLGSLFAKGGEVGAPDHLMKMAKIYHAKKFADGGEAAPFYVAPMNVAAATIPTIQGQLRQEKGKSGGPQMPKMPGSGGAAGEDAAVPDAAVVGGDAGGAGAMAGGTGAEAGLGSLAELAPLLALKKGGKVPGKPQVKGNSYKNDTVPAILSPEEVVLPNSVTQAADAPSKAAEFMKHIQDKKKGEDEPQGFDSVIQAKKSTKERLADLERLCMGGKS